MSNFVGISPLGATLVHANRHTDIIRAVSHTLTH